MKQRLLDKMVCSSCKGLLDIEVRDTDEQSGDIINATLSCKQCERHYPVKNGIPNMLP
jgi:uncharacterized protein YbaR (Trm112 family)